MCSAGNRPIPDIGSDALPPTQPTGVLMLDVDQETLEKLLAERNDYRSIFQRHAELNKKVDKAGRGELPLSDNALVDMKKEKLALKDQMMEIIHQFK